jgi:hypothetical protein
MATRKRKSTEQVSLFSRPLSRAAKVHVKGYTRKTSVKAHDRKAPKRRK